VTSSRPRENGVARCGRLARFRPHMENRKVVTILHVQGLTFQTTVIAGPLLSY
jgi:hypothetical protein